MIKELSVILKDDDRGRKASRKGDIDGGCGGGILFVSYKLDSGFFQGRFVVVNGKYINITMGVYRELVRNGGI